MAKIVSAAKSLIVTLSRFLNLKTFTLLLRYCVTAGGALLVAHSHFVTGSGVEFVGGLVPTVAPVIWGWVTQLQASAAVKEAAVTGVPTQPKMLSPVTASAAAEAHAIANAP